MIEAHGSTKDPPTGRSSLLIDDVEVATIVTKKKWEEKSLLKTGLKPLAIVLSVTNSSTFDR